MIVETGDDLAYDVLLRPETPDEMELCAAIVECIRDGGRMIVVPRNDAQPIQLKFDGASVNEPT